MRTNKIRYAWRLFRSVKQNAKDGFSECIDLRFLCRYHLYDPFYKMDFDWRWQFQHPRSRAAFIQACELGVLQAETVYINGLYDHFNHYLRCHRIALTLRLLARKYPLVWWLAFHLP